MGKFLQEEENSTAICASLGIETLTDNSLQIAEFVSGHITQQEGAPVDSPAEYN